MMNKPEDLQKKYEGKHGELKPAVPLAADSAHLLTDYLDTINVQLIRHNVLEAYRITREFEEILVQKLQQQGTKTKLTYDVTSEVLDAFGSPEKVVEQYIKENEPERFQSSHIPSKTPSQYSEFSDGYDMGLMTTKRSSYTTYDGDNSHFIFKILTVAILLSSIFVAAQLFIFTILSIPSGRVFARDEYFPVFFIFIALELYTGLSGRTIISSRYYNNLRETFRFLMTSYLILGIMTEFRMANGIFLSTRILDKLFFIYWVMVYGVGFIKDHVDLFHTFSRPKPAARFLLPSYILLILAYTITGFAVLIGDNTQYGINSIIWIVFLATMMVISGLFLDYRRRYPYSFKKLGYSIVYGLVPFIALRYWVVQDSSSYFVYHDDALSLTSGLLFVSLLVIIPLVFRAEVKEQLSDYRATLEDYQSL